MARIMWSELFPTKFSLIIFISYMLLFVNQGILVTASQGPNNNYVYNTVTVVLFTEILKLVLSTILYCKNHTWKSLFEETIKHSKVLGLYFVPAFLYCIYNNLAFENLSAFDPTTYNLLLQLRVVITGVLFQCIFKKQLSGKQWFSLILLTIGCMLKAVNFDQFLAQTSDEQIITSIITSKNSTIRLNDFQHVIELIFILIQVLCSCLAGVYNEHLLKKTGHDVNIFIQNIFMYIDSIICNVLVLMLQGKLTDAFTTDSLQSILHYKVILIMCNSATVGIITSLFLKSLNSILKTFASALELVFTAVFSYIFLGMSIPLNTMCAIAVVSYAVYLYSKAPIVNNVPNESKIIDKKCIDKDKELLLKPEEMV